MKKFWRIRNDPDIRQCLNKLNVDEDYIKILLEEDSDFIKYLNEEPIPRYVYITFNLERHRDINNYFGWMKDESFGILKGWQFCGEINMRKEKLTKLKKLNGEYR